MTRTVVPRGRDAANFRSSAIRLRIAPRLCPALVNTVALPNRHAESVSEGDKVAAYQRLEASQSLSAVHVPRPLRRTVAVSSAGAKPRWRWRPYRDCLE